jgi:hypothetical protein
VLKLKKISVPKGQVSVSPRITVLYFEKRAISVTAMKLGVITQALPSYLNSSRLFQHGGHLTSDTEAKLNEMK